MKKNIVIKSLFIIQIFALTYQAKSQDFIRFGLANDFNKSKLLQTVSFDFNRTEKIDEKKGKFIIFKNNFYLLPSSDINLGDGVTSSENNVLFQINMGKAHFGKPRKSDDSLSIYVNNQAFEFNPSYNSDKLFDSKLFYGQFKYLYNFISQTFSKREPDASIKSVSGFAIGPVANIGYRRSATYNKESSYVTLGILSEYKIRFLDEKREDKLILKLSGNYYSILSDLGELTNDKYAGNLKISIDRRVYDKIFIGLLYKYGNDNPNYKYIHTLELSTKIKY